MRLRGTKSNYAWLLIALLFTASSCMKNANVPPAGADEIVYLPSGKAYPRTPQRIPGEAHDPRFDLVTIVHRNLGEAAQVYADFSGLEVRVTKVLTERAMKLQGGSTGSLPGNTAIGYVIESLTWQLEYEGIEVVKLGKRVVAFRENASLTEPIQPRIATDAEVARFAAAMSEDRFWDLTENARQSGKGSCQRMAAALLRALSRLSEDEILGFDLRHNEMMARSYRFDLWAVAYLANGGCSSDGFEYFRAWLIGQGRETFEAALKHPPDAVRAVPDAQLGMGGIECEELLYSSMQAFEAKTGQLPPQMPVRREPLPQGKPWREEDLPMLYPDLAKRIR